jgi:hypothetical protein
LVRIELLIFKEKITLRKGLLGKEDGEKKQATHVVGS